jgi:hypothetical protein
MYPALWSLTLLLSSIQVLIAAPEWKSINQFSLGKQRQWHFKRTLSTTKKA